MKQLTLACTAALCAGHCAVGSANAQDVIECYQDPKTVQAIAEPFEDSFRNFANGNITVVFIDTIEPAVIPFHLVIMHPPRQEPFNERLCHSVGPFSGLDFDNLNASYDPNRGLTLHAPVQLYNSVTDGFDDVTADITINQATGVVELALSSSVSF